MLKVENLTVNYGAIRALKNISFNVEKGEIISLIGSNGAGKTTTLHSLSNIIKKQSGTVTFKGEDITKVSGDKRAKAGLFLSFQNPLEVPGISLSSFLKTALEQQRGVRIKAWDFRKELRQAMALLQMDNKYAERDLNTGFSGGEKKKAEILQLLMLNPQLAILDETDSGLDVDAVKIVSQGIKTFQEHRNGALLIITHNTKILEALHVDKTHILAQGSIIKNAGPELVEEISKHGFEQFLQK